MLLSLLAAQSFYDVVEKSIHKGISVGLEKSMQMSFCGCFFLCINKFLKGVKIKTAKNGVSFYL